MNSDTAQTAYRVPSSEGFSQSQGELFKPSVYGPVKPLMSARFEGPVECLQPVPIQLLKSSIKERVLDTVVNKLTYAHSGLPYEHNRQGNIGFYDLDYAMFVQGGAEDYSGPLHAFPCWRGPG